MNKKVIAAVLVIVVVVAAVAILLFKPFSGKDTGTTIINAGTTNEVTITQEPATVKANDLSLLAKTWYGDRNENQNEMLIINQDGSYKGSGFLYEGICQLKDGILTCQGIFEGIVEFKVVKVNGQTKLFYDNGDYSFYYHDVKEDAIAAIEAKNKAEEERVERLKEEAPKILLGTWMSTDGETTTIKFTEDQYSIVYLGSAYIEPAAIEHSYKIEDVSVFDNEYIIKIVYGDKEGGYTNNTTITMTVKDDLYNIGCLAFEYCRSYERLMTNSPEEAAAVEDAMKKAAEEKVNALATEEEAKVKVENESIEKAQEEVSLILLGTWTATEGRNVTLTFTEDQYIINYLGGIYAEPDEIIYSYQIEEINVVSDGKYSIKINRTKTTPGSTSENNQTINLTRKENMYTIGSLLFDHWTAYEKQATDE